MKALLCCTVMSLFFNILSAQTWIKLDTAQLDGPPKYYDSMGDTWVGTWDSNDNLFIAFGDGSGFGQEFPSFHPLSDSCQLLISSPSFWEDKFCDLAWTNCGISSYCPGFLSDAGLGIALGPLGNITASGNTAHNIPGDTEWVDSTGTEVSRNDKPSSLLFFNDTLYATLHTKEDVFGPPFTHSDTGYVAYSIDSGATWTNLISSTPWVKGDPKGMEKFTVLMWINMGMNFADDQDGYVYAMGIGREIFWLENAIYLARVPKHHIADYNSYEYLVGYNGNNPVFKPYNSITTPDTLTPLPGVTTLYKGSAIYHQPTNSYLFMASDLAGELDIFQAPKPWGPWDHVATLIELDGVPYGGSVPSLPTLIPPGWGPDSYIPGLLCKDAGPDSVFFTIANVGDSTRYQFTTGLVRLSGTAVTSIDGDIESNTLEFQVFPNPTEHSLNLRFTLTASERLSIGIYNSLGQLVNVVEEGTVFSKGKHQLNYDPDLEGGLYFITVKRADQILGSRKVLILK